MSGDSNRYELLRSMYRLNSRMSWFHRVQGIDISRCFEYTTAYQKVASGAGRQVLDIGSYRSPFPAFLAQQGYEVLVVDIDITISEQRRWVRKALGKEVVFSICLADGTHLPFSNQAFDIITCISTIEHLPGNRDIHMAREIGRVLRPGGHCFISVPYSTATKEGSWGRWFQRWFNVPTAFTRLVSPSGLSLIAHGFLMGGKVGRMADLWYTLPRFLRHTLSWSHILLFPKAFEIDTSDQSDARVLWLFLEK